MTRSLFGRFTLVMAGWAVSLTACANPTADPLAPSLARQRPAAVKPAPTGLGGGLGGLVPLVGNNIVGQVATTLANCTAVAPNSNTVTIGRNGGTISTSHGKLTIPAGALASDVAITMQQTGGVANSIEFYPSGLTFAVPAKLDVSYANCAVSPVGAYRVIYIDINLVFLENEASIDDPVTRTVRATINHFSRYAVAW